MNRLKEIFKEEIAPALKEELSIDNVMEVPTVQKIVVNVGVGDALENPKALDEVVRDLTVITGQRPVVTKAKKSIASFKLREGRIIGAKVTLRGDRMWAFLDRLVNVALPRVRDFRGISADAFDGRGNYTLGLQEQLIFPEISYDDVSILRGMEVSIVTTAENDDQARALLSKIGMPFRKG
ncbi:MAG: 50S ribosomal protein L5 [Chloroflexi bacterium]|jgi:large subunit ribosomal protein L5|nr:50S ribosomal protein L5 [Chloroflexota bacterium]